MSLNRLLEDRWNEVTVQYFLNLVVYYSAQSSVKSEEIESVLGETPWTMKVQEDIATNIDRVEVGTVESA